MNTTRIVAILLIIGGIAGLVYGSFSYTKESTAVKLGPIELTVKEKQTINVPVWAGLVAIAAGASLLLMAGKRG